MLLHRVTVGLEHSILAAEGAHQHEQRGLRQVKVCEQRPHHAEVVVGISRVNKDIGLRVPCLRTASSVLTVVVPTATILCPESRERLIVAAASGEIE